MLPNRSGSNRTPPHAPFCLFLFCFCVPPRLLFRPFWPWVQLLGVFSARHSGPRGFLGFSWNLWGLSSLPLLRPLFLGREAAGFCCASLVLGFSLSPFLFCGCTLFTRKPAPVISRRQLWVISPAPRIRVRARGFCPSRTEGWSPPDSGFLTAFLCTDHRDPRTHCVLGLLCTLKGAFFLPPQARFHTHFLFCIPGVFFFWPSGPDALRLAQLQLQNEGILCTECIRCIGITCCAKFLGILTQSGPSTVCTPIQKCSNS